MAVSVRSKPSNGEFDGAAFLRDKETFDLQQRGAAFYFKKLAYLSACGNRSKPLRGPDDSHAGMPLHRLEHRDSSQIHGQH